MSDYETEDQQVEALQKWWKENRNSLFVGLIVGVSTLFGWRYYNDQQQVHAVQASNMYMQLMQSASVNIVDDKVIDINNKLINDYSDTPYAGLSSLALAKVEYEKGNAEAAVAQLELAVSHSSDENVKHVANLRLISIFIEQEKYDEAAASLSLQHDVAFDARYEELKGDLYKAKGEIELARSSYDKAIELYGTAVSKILILKRQNLGSSSVVGRVDISHLDGGRMVLGFAGQSETLVQSN